MINNLFDYSKTIYPKLLTSSEIQTIKYYTVSNFYDINQSLRNNDIHRFSDEICMLDSALNKFNNPSNLIVYRYINGTEDKMKKIVSQLENGYYIDEAYTSTTLNQKLRINTFYKIFMTINLKSVNIGALIKYISKFPYEDEFLIKRNTKLYTKSIKLKNNNGDLVYNVKMDI